MWRSRLRALQGLTAVRVYCAGLCILGALAHTKARAIISRGGRSETDLQIIAQAYPEIGGHIGTSAMDWISA